MSAYCAPVDPPEVARGVVGVTGLVDQAAAQPPGEHADAGRDGQEGARALAGEAARLVEQAARVALVEPARGITRAAGDVVDQAARHAVLVRGPGHRAELVGQLAQAPCHARLLGGRLVGEVAAGLAPQLAHLVGGLPGDLLGLLPCGLRDVPRCLLGLVSYGARSVRGGLRSGRLGLHEYPVLSSGRRRIRRRERGVPATCRAETSLGTVDMGKPVLAPSGVIRRSPASASRHPPVAVDDQDAGVIASPATTQPAGCCAVGNGTTTGG